MSEAVYDCVAEEDPYLARALLVAEITANRLSCTLTDPAIGREDWVAEAYLAAVRAHRRYDPGRGASRDTWIGQQVRYALQEFLRQQDFLTRGQRKRAREEPGNPLFLPPAPLHALMEDEDGLMQEPGIWDDLEGLHARLDLRRAISRLRPFDRALIDLTFREGVALREIGRELGVGENRAQQLRRYSLDRIREELGDWEDAEMTTATKRVDGECIATYDAVLAYLLAHYAVSQATAERAMKRPWAVALHGRGLAERWAAWEVGDKIAWPMKWPWLGEERG